MMHTPVMGARTIAVIMISLVVIGAAAAYAVLLPTMRGHGKSAQRLENQPSNAYPSTSSNVIIVDMNKLIKQLSGNKMFRSIMFRFNLTVSLNDVVIKEALKNGNKTILILVFKNTSYKQVYLIIKCIIDNDSNLRDVISVTPVLEPTISGDERFNMSKANQLAQDPRILESVYNDPLVHPLMVKYGIGFNEFVRIPKKAGLARINGRVTLLWTFIIVKINESDEYRYVPIINASSVPMDNGCPLSDIVDVFFYIENNNIHVWNVTVIHDVPCPLCYTQPMRR